MGNLWLKIRVWTKIIVISAALLYLLLFFLENKGESVTIWVWFDHQLHPSLPELIASLLAGGVLGTLLVRAAMSTVRQLRELSERGRHARLERSVADMQSKAAMLQTRPEPTDSAGHGSAPPTPSPSHPSSHPPLPPPAS